MCASFANFEEFGRCLNNQSQLTQISIDKENRAKQVLAKSLEKKETLTKEILKLGLWDSGS
jgi:hypothetical protein